MRIEAHTPTELLGFVNEIEKKYAPEMLYLSGDATLLQQGPKVAIVGSRKASSEGLSRARKLVKRLVELDVVVVSGLAMGIDTVAHTSAIEFGGRTITVLGTPLDKPSPKENTVLFEEICTHHLAVSQFPVGRTTHRGDFPMRNRTMALLSDATVIVEAGEKSGTEHQGWEAIRLGRELFLLESLVSKGHKWPLKLIEYGAQVIRDDNIDAVLESLPSAIFADVVAF